MTEWRVDESLLELIRDLAYCKHRIASLAWEKHIYRREMIRFSGWNKREYDRVCRALIYYRMMYEMTCKRIHAALPYR